MALCNVTGLEVVEGPKSGNYRIVRSSYGPLAPKEREVEADGTFDTAAWSRFDTAGHTLYTTDDGLTPFMEFLAPYQIEINGARRARNRTPMRWGSRSMSTGQCCRGLGPGGHDACPLASLGLAIRPEDLSR
jgi:hypothetical protein